MKYISKLILSLVFIILISSCEKSDLNENSLETIEFSKIGKAHNNALDFINTNYKNLNSLNKSAMSEDDKIQFIIDNVDAYLSDKEFIVNDLTISEFHKPTVQEFKNFLTAMENSNMGEFEKYKNDEIAEISDIIAIENEYLNGTELINYKYLTTGSILKSSLNYWDQSQGMNKNQKSINWYAIALADGNAAYGGFTWGGISGGPVGAIGGAISMGILGSAYAGFIASLW